MPEIVLECNPDEALIKVLGYTRKMITHQPGRGEVINYLQRNPSAIGIVDEDPGSAKPTYFSKFTHESDEQFDIASFHIPKLRTRLIVIKPRLEEWILKQALESKINPKSYSLPEDANDLHKIINTKIPLFEKMIKEMLEKGNSGLKHLKNLIDKK